MFKLSVAPQWADILWPVAGAQRAYRRARVAPVASFQYKMVLQNPPFSLESTGKIRMFLHVCFSLRWYHPAFNTKQSCYLADHKMLSFWRDSVTFNILKGNNIFQLCLCLLSFFYTYNICCIDCRSDVFLHLQRKTLVCIMHPIGVWASPLTNQVSPN